VGGSFFFFFFFWGGGGSGFQCGVVLIVSFHIRYTSYSFFR